MISVKSRFFLLLPLFYITLAHATVETVALSPQEKIWLQLHPEISVGGGPDWAPFDFVAKNGSHSGIANDYLNLVSKKTGLKFNISIDQWSHNLQKIKNQEIDLLPAVYYTEERSQYLTFSPPYFEMLDYFFVRNDLNVKTLADLDGKRVAIPRDYAHEVLLKKHFPAIQIVTVDSFTDAIEAVLENRADMLYDTYASLSYTLKKEGINTIIPFRSTRYLGKNSIHFATQKEALELASIIQKGVNVISDHEKQAIYDKWIGKNITEQNNTLPLSNEEQKWLNEHQVIRYAGDPNWLPYEAFDKDNQYIGIAAEHLKLIEQKLGINIQLIPTKSWAESVEKVRKGEIDVLSESSDSELQSHLSFTEDYIASPIVIVMRNNQDYVENINQIKQRTISVIKDYGYVAEIIQKYPNLNFHYVDTLQEGLTAVSTGKTDALLATLAQASYQISELGINNIRIVGKTEFTTKLAFGMSEEFAPLVPLFNRAIQSISPKEKRLILDNWGKQKFAAKTDYSLLAKVVGALLFFMLIMAYWNRRLSKEMSLRAEVEQQTKMLIDSIPIQIVVTSFDGQLLSANPQALNDYKLHIDDLDQYNILEFYANMHDRKDVIAELEEHAKIDQKIIPMKQPDGSIHSMMISIMPIKYHKKSALLSIAVNMTERLEIEAALKSAKSHAESANRAKSEFLANMSHEIRTPMNAIIGFTELLNEQIKEPKLKSFVKIIQSAGNNLLTLINDILDLSKIEAGKFQIENKPCNPHDLFTELGDVFMLKMQEKNIDFIIDIAPSIPQSLQLDATRLRQVLFNLIGNAVKFTNDGFIKVKVNMVNEDKIRSKLDLLIDVEDSGIGIADDQQAIIFKEFEQSSGQGDTFGGTGLGLSISKHLVNMMGGQLSLKSKAEMGSTFTIILTGVDVASLTVEAKKEQAQPKTIIEFKPANILIVDDVKDNQNLLLANFSETKVQTVTAENGLEAVKLAKQQPFDLILMDLRMPVMNGYEAAEKIKSFSTIPIVALTASVMTDDFERDKHDYFDGYLRKPIRKADLISELCKFLAFEEESIDENRSEVILLSNKERESLPQLLLVLEEQRSLYETCLNSNNIADIKLFSAALSKAEKQSPVPLFTHYAAQLALNIDSFDIAAVKQALSAYPKLIMQLESLGKQ